MGKTQFLRNCKVCRGKRCWSLKNVIPYVLATSFLLKLIGRFEIWAEIFPEVRQIGVILCFCLIKLILWLKIWFVPRCYLGLFCLSWNLWKHFNKPRIFLLPSSLPSSLPLLWSSFSSHLLPLETSWNGLAWKKVLYSSLSVINTVCNVATIITSKHQTPWNALRDEGKRKTSQTEKKWCFLQFKLRQLSNSSQPLL